MNKIITLAAIAAIALSSCSKDTPSADATSASNAIEFRTNLSKATPTNGGNFSAFTLNATNSVQGVTVPFNFMNNLKVSKDINLATWDYAPKRFWPVGNPAINFYAYSPVGSRNITSSITNPSVGTSLLTYKVPLIYASSGPTDEDFVVAQTSAISGIVSLAFTHALSMATFEARNTTDTQHGVKYVIESIKLINLENEAVLTQLSAGTFSWTITPAGKIKTYEVPLISSGINVHNPTAAEQVDVDLNNGYKKVTPEGYGRMILPQKTADLSGATSLYFAPGASGMPAAGTANVGTWLVVTYRSTDGSGNVMNATGSQVYFPLSNFTFIAGTNHVFRFSFAAGSPIQLNPSIIGWPTVNAPELP